MKITIDIDESQNYGLSPNYVYKRLRDEHYESVVLRYQHNFWGMEHSCDVVARDLYSRLTKRSSNVKSLILTYHDAENCFKIYKDFSEAWMKILQCSD